MSYLETLWNGLKSSVGKNRDNDPNDILKVEKSLKNVGYFDEEHSHGFITKTLHDGIEKFQRDQNLKSDGFVLPGGETEKALFNNVPIPTPKPKQMDERKEAFEIINTSEALDILTKINVLFYNFIGSFITFEINKEEKYTIRNQIHEDFKTQFLEFHLPQ